MRIPLLLLLFTAPGTLGAVQDGIPTRLTLEFGDSRYSGGLREPTTPIDVHPDRNTAITVRLTTTHFGIAATYGSSVSEFDASGVIVDGGPSALLLELAPEVRLPLWRSAAKVDLSAHAGPLVSLWAVSSYPATVRLGVQAGASLDFPLSGRFGLSLRFDAATGGAYIADDDVDPGLTAERMWRTRLGLGLSFALSAPD